ncbi:hypothetical protein SSX86_020465 [Deinandra increscens subsp. villosa]|uniref:DUF674 domain-containing protein n=1 Tax=Deinandra increscens subsp. villosa TaxID=3103831 RepID=A0AAP0GS95_9ASTR
MASSSTVSLKLYIDNKGQRVLYAEAGKDFIDFLLTLLALPFGTIARLLEDSRKIDQGVGLLKVYSGILNMKTDYQQPNWNINGLLKPGYNLPSLYSLPVVMNYNLPTQTKLGGAANKSVMIYMVMDDLVVSPMIMSAISNINLLKGFKIKDLDAVEEKVVHMGMTEGLELLKHSLNSKTVLTDVFVRKRSVV